jgi:hypothetical protein
MARLTAARRVRGQALVETSLGLIVFISLLMFCIHFAEVGYISVKVTEASHSAMLDSTGYKLHSWPDDVGPASSAAAQAGQEAQARYADFDSRRSSNGSATLTQVFTRADGMQVECATGGAPSHEPNKFTTDAYSDNGGVTCRSQARITAINLPRDFLEDANQGFFTKKHYEASPITVCAIGRAKGGSCQGGLIMMVDDWGLSGSDESRECELTPDAPGPCENKAFWNMANSVYENSGKGMGVAGSTMAKEIVGKVPEPFSFGGEETFWLSAMGEESQMAQNLPSEGFENYPTSPGIVSQGMPQNPYTLAYQQRDSCFLGRKCS